MIGSPTFVFPKQANATIVVPQTRDTCLKGLNEWPTRVFSSSMDAWEELV